VAAESWEGFKSKYDYDEAVHYMNKGYSQLGKVVNKLDEGQVDSAIRHFNWANKDFNKALAYYADAVLPAEDKDAVNALKKGLDAFQKAEKTCRITMLSLPRTTTIALKIISRRRQSY
jgi:hypothetical protein